MRHSQITGPAIMNSKECGDQSFDDRAREFRERIYGSDKGLIRLEVLRQDFREILRNIPEGTSLDILDAGGGFGAFSRELACAGHRVTVVDISEEMLEIGRRDTADYDFSEKGGSISFLNGAVQDLPELFPGRKFDIVICHAVLVYNRTALLFKSLLVGNYRYLENGMRPLRRKGKMRMTPPNPLIPGDVREALTGLGFPDTVMSGVRVFHDYMARCHLEEIPADEILSWELRMRRNPDFVNLGRYVHIFGSRKSVFPS